MIGVKMKVKFNHFGKEYHGQIIKNNYANGKLAIQLRLDSGEPYATLSVNTDDILSNDEFVAKTYSENDGLVEQFIKLGIFEDTGNTVQCGYVECPILKIK
jgi:hypothetical protein